MDVTTNCALQLDAAVGEVALQRLMAAEQQPRAFNSKDVDPARIPIEAPRAKRSMDVSNSASLSLLPLVAKDTPGCLHLAVQESMAHVSFVNHS